MEIEEYLEHDESLILESMEELTDEDLEKIIEKYAKKNEVCRRADDSKLS